MHRHTASSSPVPGSLVLPLHCVPVSLVLLVLDKLNFGAIIFRKPWAPFHYLAALQLSQLFFQLMRISAFQRIMAVSEAQQWQSP